MISGISFIFLMWCIYYKIKMKQILIFISILSLTFSSFVTEQEADLLIIENDTIYLKEFPLEKLELEKRPFGNTRITAPSSACWRGYKAVWRKNVS